MTGARYLDSPERTKTSRVVQAVFASLLALVVLILPSFSSVANANDFEDVLKKTASDSNVSGDEKGFDKLNDSMTGDTLDENSFAYVVSRVMGTRYLNHTPRAVPAKGQPNREWNCDVKDPRAGTPLYHNCDVPSVMTEFLQKMVQTVSPQGFSQGTVSSNRAPFTLTVPSGIPGGRVPLDYAKSSTKYTALEVYGYNLKYTAYRGEWDHIQVMNDARVLSNYGGSDAIALGAQAVAYGVTEGVKQGSSIALEKLSQGNVLKAGIAGYQGFWSAGAASSANVVLDSSDLNVFNSYSWYRLEYGGTLYNARELDQLEMGGAIKASISAMIEDSRPNAIDLPQDFITLRTGPPERKSDVSKCVIDGREFGAGTPAPGVTKAQCESVAGGSKYTWSEDGNQKGETIAEWEKHPWFSKARQYGIDCELQDLNGASNQVKAMQNFYTCVDREWVKQSERVEKEAQAEEYDRWVEEAFDNSYNWMSSHQEHNWNAPWSRLVCTKLDGSDMRDATGGFVFLYDANGVRNPRCEPVRPPVQDGYYGNGYRPENGNVSPESDGRREAFQELTVLSLFFDYRSNSTMWANVMLRVSGTATMASNMALDLSFSPILERFGIEKRFINLIKTFRESLFFPLICIMMAFAGLSVFFSAIPKRQYAKGLRDLALSLATFLFAVVVLFQPKILFDLSDRLPSAVERVVASAIFNTADDDSDQLCTATDTSKVKSFTPSTDVRSLECEVWRTFFFDPYVSAQWGAPYSQLHDVTSNEPGKLEHGSTELVGDAKVNLGGGSTIRNWALYQTEVLGSGTITTTDPDERLNVVPRDLYRVVDVQVGPNQSAGRNSEHFQTWSGENAAYRLILSFMGMVIALVGAFTVIVFSLAKIQVTFITALMLLLAPFVMLIAVHPVFGRVQLKKWFGTIVGLMVKRVFLLLLLCVMLRLITTLSLSSGNPLIMGMITLGVCFTFLSKRDEMTNKIHSATVSSFGGSKVAPSTGSIASKFVPRSFKNQASIVTARERARFEGAVGGFLGGGLHGAQVGARRSSQYAETQQKRLQRRKRYGFAQSLADASTDSSRMVDHHDRSEVNRLRNSPAYKRSVWNKMQALHAERSAPKLDGTRDKIFIDLEDDRNRELSENVINLDKEIEDARRLKEGRPEDLPNVRPRSPEEIANAQSIVREHHERYDRMIADLESRKNATLDELHGRAIEQGYSPEEAKKDHLDELHERMRAKAARTEYLNTHSAFDTSTPVTQDGDT